MKRERTNLAILLLAVVCPLATNGQDFERPVLRLKSGQMPPNLLTSGEAEGAARALVRRTQRAHQLIQFAEFPTEENLAVLRERGAQVLSYVPDNAVLVSGPDSLDLDGLAVVYRGALSGADKFSSLIAMDDEPVAVVVEFHADVDAADARRIVLDEGLEIAENPDMAPTQLLVRGTSALLRPLADWDEVARVFPAAGELVQGKPVVPCHPGAVGLEQLQAAANLVTSFGDGWDGPGLGATSLYYYFGRMPASLTESDVRRELIRALKQWSAVVQVHFSQAYTSRLRKEIEFNFMPRNHNDGYNFDGPGGIAAHSFYPPPNAETIAGDLHFDTEETWKIGADVDVFSIALHELGHTLGLGHNDDPNSVMYPYYRQVNGLRPADITEIRKLYAASGTVTTPATPTVPTAPATPPSGDTTAPSLTISSPSATVSYTTASTVTVRGSASDNVGVALVSWSKNGGTGGNATGTTAFSTGPIPLFYGINTVTIRAWDAAGNQRWRSITITRR